MSAAAALAAMNSGSKSTSSYALREAAERGRVAVVRRELEKGVSPDDSPTTGITALHRAAEKDRADVVAVLCSYGANINSKTKASGDTPMHIASWRGHLATIKELMAQGSDLKVPPAQCTTHNARAARLSAPCARAASQLLLPSPPHPPAVP